MEKQLIACSDYQRTSSICVARLQEKGSLASFVQSGQVGKKRRAHFRADTALLGVLRDRWWNYSDNSPNAVSGSGTWFAEILNGNLHIINTATLESVVFKKIDIPHKISYRHNKNVCGVNCLFWKDDEFICLGYNNGCIQVINLEGRCVASRILRGFVGRGAWSGSFLALSMFPTEKHENRSDVGTFLFNGEDILNGSEKEAQPIEDICDEIGGIANHFAWMPGRPVLLGVCSSFMGEKNYDSIVWRYDLISRQRTILASENSTPTCGPEISSFSPQGYWAISMFDEIILYKNDVVVNRVAVNNPPDYHLVPRMATDGTVHLYDWKSDGGYLRIIPGGNRLHTVKKLHTMPEFKLRAVLTDNRYFGFANIGVRQPCLIDGSSVETQLRRLPQILFAGALGFDINARNGNLAIAASGDDSIRVFSTSLDCLHSLRCGCRAGNPFNIRWLDETRMAVSTYKNRGILLDVASPGTIVHTRAFAKYVAARGTTPVWSKTTVLSAGGFVAEVDFTEAIAVSKKSVRMVLEMGSPVKAAAFHESGLVVLHDSGLVDIPMPALKELFGNTDNHGRRINGLEYFRCLLCTGSDKFQNVQTDGVMLVLAAQDKVAVYAYDARRGTCTFSAARNMPLSIKAFPWTAGDKVVVCRSVRYTFLTNKLQKIADLYLLPNDNFLVHVRAPVSSNTHPGYLWASGGNWEFLFRCYGRHGKEVTDAAQKRLVLAPCMNKEMVEMALQPGSYDAFTTAHERMSDKSPVREKPMYRIQLPLYPKSVFKEED